jgi:hypothetical protein
VSSYGHQARCRAAIYHGTRFEKDWPTDPERCDACAQRPGQRRSDHEPQLESTAICPDLAACTRLFHPEQVPGESCECCGLIIDQEGGPTHAKR